MEHKILEANMAKVSLRKNVMLHHTMLFSLNLQKQRFVIMHSLQQKSLLDINEETFLKSVFKRCKELLTECLTVFGQKLVVLYFFG